MRSVARAAAWLLVALALPAHPHEGAHAPGAPGAGDVSATGRAWDFTLPTLDGSRFVQASSIGGPVLVNFWGKDCGPCITELPRLAAFAREHPGWTVLLVSTDPPSMAAEFARRIGLSGTVLRPGANVQALMRSVGNRHGALPFSVALRGGRICRTQLGELHESVLAQWSAACTPP
jgi:outer membrane receptor for ferrienterochelin and colicins